MMRKPTPLYRSLEFWQRSLRGERVDVIEGFPECGFYRTRLVKGGPWVPVRVWLHQVVDFETGELTEPEYHMCEINMRPADPYERWSYFCKHPVLKSQYDEMVRFIEWAGSNDPTHPVLTPYSPQHLEERIPLPC